MLLILKPCPSSWFGCGLALAVLLLAVQDVPGLKSQLTSALTAATDGVFQCWLSASNTYDNAEITVRLLMLFKI